jgi:7-carboxy-7-deazaguanine synthase
VICSRSDYEWAKLKYDELGLGERFGEVLFSPSTPDIEPRALADWIVADRLPVRFQMQLHKILWGSEPGR